MSSSPIVDLSKWRSRLAYRRKELKFRFQKFLDPSCNFIAIYLFQTRSGFLVVFKECLIHFVFFNTLINNKKVVFILLSVLQWTTISAVGILNAAFLMLSGNSHVNGKVKWTNFLAVPSGVLALVWQGRPTVNLAPPCLLQLRIY